MSWTDLAAYWGLRKPYNFGAAIPFLWSLMLLSIIFSVGVVLFLSGSLNPGTPRFYFFIYVAALLLLSVASARVAVLPYIILGWCTVELCLALASSALEQFGLLGTSLLPQNSIDAPLNAQISYHPLLQRVLKPNSDYTWHLGPRPKGTKLTRNWAYLENRTLTFHHNSMGLRGKEVTREDLDKKLIFVYGGSTTYDISVTQGETWVEQLQTELGRAYTVLNFGVSAYSTTENILQTAFYQDVIPKKPVCAIYYVGWNDIASAHLDSLDGAYANYHLLLTTKRRADLAGAPYSPLLRTLDVVARLRFDSVPLWPRTPTESLRSGSSDPRLEAIFAEHIRMLAAINRARGIQSVFIAQMLNPRYGGDNGIWAPFLHEGQFWPLQVRFNAILKETALASSAGYIDPGIEHFSTDDFADMGHFAASGSRKFASLVSHEVASYCP